MSRNNNRPKKKNSGNRGAKKRPARRKRQPQPPAVYATREQVPWDQKKLERAFGRDSAQFDNGGLWGGAIPLQALLERPEPALSTMRIIRLRVSRSVSPKLDALVLATKSPQHVLTPDASITMLAMRTLSGPSVTYVTAHAQTPIGRLTWIPPRTQQSGYFTALSPATVAVLYGVRYSKQATVNYYQHPPTPRSLPVSLGLDRLKIRQLRSGAIDIYLPTGVLVWTLPPDHEISPWTEEQAAEARMLKLQSEHPGLLVPLVVEAKDSEDSDNSNSPESIPGPGEAIDFRQDLRYHAAEEVNVVDLRKKSLCDDSLKVVNRQFWFHSQQPATFRVSLTIANVRVRIRPEDLSQKTQSLLFA
jgi:hypothetical protein